MRRWLSSLIVSVVLGLSVGQASAHQAPSSYADLQVAPAGSAPVRFGLLDVDVTVRPRTAASTTLLRVEGDGVFAGYSERFERRGPWQSGDELHVSFRARPDGFGEGSLRVSAVLIDPASGAQLLARRDLHLLYEPGRAWWSNASPSVNRLARAEDRMQDGASEDEVERELQSTLRTASVAGGGRRRVPATTDDDRAPGGTIAAGLAGTEVTVTVSGTVRWTDKNGATHPVPMALLDVLEDDFGLNSETLLDSTSTDAQGFYSVSVTVDDGLGEGYPDLFIRVNSSSLFMSVRPDSSLFDNPYVLESDVVDEVATSAVTIDATAAGLDDAATAFSVSSAFASAGLYAATLAGSVPDQRIARFPTTRAGSLFDRESGEVHLTQLDRWDWDVVQHEYGHVLTNVYGFSDSPGGDHAPNESLSKINERGKDAGLRLAWGEGWPNFFALSSQAGLAGLGIPTVGNAKYEDLENSNLIVDFEASRTIGEDNEVSVGGALWDMWDPSSPAEERDTVQISPRRMFKVFQSGMPTVIGNAWDLFANPLQPEDRVRLGAVFGMSGIAPELTEPADGFEPDEMMPPTFKWRKGGLGIFHPLDDFSLIFYSSNYTEVLRVDNLTTNEYTPTGPQWLGALAAGAARWVIEGKSTASPPQTPGPDLGVYWSGDRLIGGADLIFVLDDSGSMDEEYAQLKPHLSDALTEIQNKLPMGETLVMQLISFDDSVTVHETTKDFNAMRAAIQNLVADGGGACPEDGLRALDLAARNLRPGGGGIIFASDASSNPGPPFEAITDRVVAKGGIVFSVLSGGCPTFDGAASPTTGGATSLAEQPIRIRLAQETGPGPTPVDPSVQGPADEYGDTPERATPLAANGMPVRGVLDTFDDLDYFALQVEVGVPYRIRTVTEDKAVYYALVASDGTTRLFAWADDANLGGTEGAAREVPFLPTENGPMYLHVEPALGVDPVYSVALSQDSLAEKYATYAALALATGGRALLPDRYDQFDFNDIGPFVLSAVPAAVGASVVSANPRELPRHFFQTSGVGMILWVTLRGRGTSWNGGSVVTFPAGDIAVLQTQVLDPLTLRVQVQVTPDAELGPRDVQVSTPQGGGNQVVLGRGVVEVAGQAFYEVLGIDPPGAFQGAMFTGVVDCSGFDWTDAVQVDLGAGVSVTDVRRLEPARLEVDLAVSPNAQVGWRDVTVNDEGGISSSLDSSFYVAAAPQPIPEPASGAAATAALLALTVVARRRRGGRGRIGRGPPV